MLKEYLKVPTIKARTAIYAVFAIAYLAMNTYALNLITRITEGIEAGEDVTVMLATLATLLVAVILADAGQNLLRRRDSMTVFCHTLARVTKKAVELDYGAHSKLGEARIQYAFDQANSIQNGAKAILDTGKYVVDFGIILYAIYRIYKGLVVPVLILYILGGIFLYRVFKELSKRSKPVTESKQERADQIQRVVSGFAEIMSSNTQQMHINSIQGMTDRICGLIRGKQNMVMLSNITFSSIDGLVTMCIMIYAMAMIPRGVTTAFVMAIINYAWRLMNPMVMFLDTLDEVSANWEDFRKLMAFLDTKNNVVDNGRIELDGFNHSIEFAGVSFRYNKSNEVLTNVSFTVKKGEKVGIVGSSGCGKSTLLKLIERFYDTSSGYIYIDGIRTTDYTMKSLRDKIGYVQQSSYIFKGTIWDNVTYGVSNPTEESVIDACKKAAIYDFIMSLPDKFKTDVGPNGLKLSGGQQQRISIARIFLKNPPIIILDEATSALDNESESIVQDSLAMFEGKTIITVAHRLTTIKGSDKIVVIGDNHQIEAMGTHEELLEQVGSTYWKLNQK